MDKSNESWTLRHDLALIFIALAYGTDHELTDEEIEVITATLEDWCEGMERRMVKEVVMEAMVVYREGGRSVKEVTGSMHTLRDKLSNDELARALEDVVRIAEADGILLNSERSLISTLADAWDLKRMAQGLVEQSQAKKEGKPTWSLMHDIALIYIVLAHSTDNELSEDEIQAMKDRLGEWQPDLPEEEVRNILRDALAYYSEQPSQKALYDSVSAIKEIMPRVQRLSMLEDLVHIAEADGTVNNNEDELLHTLSKAWDIGIRLNNVRG